MMPEVSPQVQFSAGLSQSGIDIELRILHMLFRSVRSPSTLPTAAIAGREPWPDGT